MAITLEIKRGDTFRQDVTVKINGVSANISDWTIKSKLRSQDKSLVETFVITKTNAAQGKYRLSADKTNTAQWPVGILKMDIEYAYDSDGEFVTSSETYDVKVIQDQTYDEP